MLKIYDVQKERFVPFCIEHNGRKVH